MALIRTDVKLPLGGYCACGWVSHDPKFDLTYHADKHKCMKAIRTVNRKEQDNG